MGLWVQHRLRSPDLPPHAGSGGPSFTSRRLFHRPAKYSGGTSMMLITRKLRRFLASDDGPTAVEYAVMLALIIVVCLVAITSLGTNAKATFDNVSNSIA